MKRLYEEWSVEVVTVPESDFKGLQALGLKAFAESLPRKCYTVQVQGHDARSVRMAARCAAKRAWCKEQRVLGIKPRVVQGFYIRSINNNNEITL